MSSPLYYAIDNNHIEAAELLIQSGADMYKEDESKLYPPLYLAICKQNIDMVRLLIRYGVDVNIGDCCRITPLEYASGWNIDIMKLLIDNGANVNTKPGDGWTPIGQAARHGHIDQVRLLIDHGADVNATDQSNWRALQKAASANHIEVMKLLMENGTNQESLNKALCTLGGSYSVESFQLLIDRGAVVTYDAVYSAIWIGRRVLLKLLLDNGGDAYLRSSISRGDIPLHTAVMNLNDAYGITSLLLEEGVPVNIRDRDNISTLDYAIANKCPDDVIQLLKDHGG